MLNLVEVVPDIRSHLVGSQHYAEHLLEVTETLWKGLLLVPL